MIILKGSRKHVTYNEASVLGVDGHIASVWGKVTSIQNSDAHEGKLFITINGSDAFLHSVDKVILDNEFGTEGIVIEIEGCRKEILGTT